MRAARTTRPSLKLLVASLTLLVLTACGSSGGGHATPTTAPTATPTEQVPALSTALVTYTGHTKAVISVAWSPDGKRLASASDDGTVQVWTAADGHRLWTYPTNPADAKGNNQFAVAWSPDGARLAGGGDDKTVHVWDAATGRAELVYRGHTNTVFVAVWSPDGSAIASCSQDGTVQVWRPVTS